MELLNIQRVAGWLGTVVALWTRNGSAFPSRALAPACILLSARFSTFVSVHKGRNKERSSAWRQMIARWRSASFALDFLAGAVSPLGESPSIWGTSVSTARKRKLMLFSGNPNEFDGEEATNWR